MKVRRNSDTICFLQKKNCSEVHKILETRKRSRRKRDEGEKRKKKKFRFRYGLGYNWVRFRLGSD